MSTLADSPRVLCIAGSPRRHGNSETLLDALIEGVREAGGSPVKLVVADAGIGACRGCGGCSGDGACIEHDGMDEVYRQLDSADAIAVATPVFFATVPAVLKLMIDRCQPYWVRRYVLGQPRPKTSRPGALLIVGGGGDPYGTACAVSPLRSVFAVLSVSADSVIEVIGPDKRGDIVEEPERLARGREAGLELVASARRAATH